MRRFTFSNDEAFTLLQQLVGVRSYPGEEAAVQQVVVDWLRQADLAAEFQDTANGQPNVVARIENGPGPTLLLNGHVDTVLAAAGWLCDPWQGRRDGDLFYALGAGDMKAGVVVNMLVARELARRRTEWQGTLIFSSVIDEEAYSLGTHTLIDADLQADACFVTEPWFAPAIIGAPGKVLVRVDVTGKAAHGFFPWEGINAAIELARFVAQVGDAAPPLQHPRIPSSQTVLSFHSGSTQYVITLPEQAQALVTRQIVPGETAEQVVEKMRAFADSLNSPAQFAFSIDPPYYPPFEFNQPGHAFTQAFHTASAQVFGQPTPLGYTAGVSDANLFNGKAGIPCFAWGPRAGNFHQCQEWVDLTTITPCAEVVARTALGFLKG